MFWVRRLATLLRLRFRLFITSVFSDIGRLRPCNLRKSPHALHIIWPFSSLRQSGVVDVRQFWHTVTPDVDRLVTCICLCCCWFCDASDCCPAGCSGAVCESTLSAEFGTCSGFCSLGCWLVVSVEEVFCEDSTGACPLDESGAVASMFSEKVGLYSKLFFIKVVMTKGGVAS